MPQIGPFCFINRTQSRVTDLLVIFTGTGGTLRAPRITAGPRGQIRARDNTVTVIWNSPIPRGTRICFTVQSRFKRIDPYLAIWTRNFNPVGLASEIFVSDSAPSDSRQ